MQPRPALSLRLEAVGALGYRGLTLACTFLGGILIARYLGPSGRGILVLLVLSAESVARLSEVGLTGASIYALGQKKATLGEVHGNLLKLVGLVVGALLLALLFFRTRPLAALWPEMPDALLLLSLLLVPLALYAFVWRGVMAGIGEQRRAQRTLFRVEAVYLAGVLALVVADAPLWTYAALVAGVYLLRAGAAGRMLLRVRSDGKPRLRKGGLRGALRFGSVTYVGALFLFLLYRVDQLVVAERLGMQATGHYTLAASLAEYPWIVTAVIANSVLHLIAGGEREQAATAACEAARQSLIVSAFAALAALLLAKPVINLLYTEAFLPSVEPLLLLLPGVAAISVAQPLLLWIAYHRGRPIWSTGIVVCGFLIHLPLLFWLLERDGITGAATASTIGYVAVLVGAVGAFCAQSGRPVRDVIVPRLSDLAVYVRSLQDLRRLKRRRDA
ncbi:MAG: oligosaccharide flippase family protein [Planctomycetota bacterium]|jgi:O-antigen/teichoic acid export membrane protein